jgi:hypothetical protein
VRIPEGLTASVVGVAAVPQVQHLLSEDIVV